MKRSVTSLLAGLGIPTLTIGTDFTGALVLATPIELEFGADITTTQWVLNIYALTFAMGMVAGGKLADSYGRRRLLLIGLVIFVTASLGCALAPSVGWLIAARAAQGVGSAIAWPSILALAATWLSEEKRGFAIGLVLGIVTFGNVIGPALGGIASGLGDWRAFFVINLILGTLSLLLVPRLVARDTQDWPEERIDFIGIALLASSVLALLYALHVCAAWGWTDPRILALFIVALALFSAFPLWEKRPASPLIPLNLLHGRQFQLALAANGLVVPAVFLLFLYIPQYLQKVYGWHIFHASIGSLPLMLCLSIFSVLSGRLYGTIGPQKLLLFGYTLVTLGCILITQFSPAWGYWGLVPAMILIGTGSGLSVGPAGTIAVGAAGQARAGLAGALSFMVHLTMGAIGVGAGTAVFTAANARHLAAGLERLSLKVSPADQGSLIGAAPGSEKVRAILDSFPAEARGKVETLVRDGFNMGIQDAYWLALALAALGIVVAFRLEEEQHTPKGG